MEADILTQERMEGQEGKGEEEEEMKSREKLREKVTH